MKLSAEANFQVVEAAVWHQALKILLLQSIYLLLFLFAELAKDLE